LYEIVENEVTKKSYIIGGKTNKVSTKTQISQHRLIYSIDRDTNLLQDDNYIGPRITIPKKRSRTKSHIPQIQEQVTQRKKYTH
jgi:hypothetical protein